MAVQAVALVHIAPSAVKAALDPGPSEVKATLENDRFDVVEGADGKVYVIECFEDATGIRLGISLSHGDPEMMGILVGAALGDLIDEHEDPRGVPLYPENYLAEARTWDGLLEEIGEAFDWVPIESAEIVEPGVGDLGELGQEDLLNLAAQMQAQLPPEMLEQAMQMAQQLAQSGGLDEIQRAMGQGMPGSLPGGPMGMDMAAMARQAQQMFEANPDLQKQIAEQFGITDAEFEEDDAEDGKKK